jgi:hypothetical protein
MHRSHSRESYPFDKMVPKMPRMKKMTTKEGYTYYEGYDTILRRLIKNMHKKKQREHDRKLCDRRMYG